MEMTNIDVKDWLDEIEQARKRDKDFRTNGETINEMYNGEMSEKIPFNILYSNTETLKPALYSQTPRPVVKRRWNQEEKPVVVAAEKAGTRILEYLLDTNVEGYERYDDSMTDAVLDAALPGRGITQIKFDAEIEETEDDGKLNWAFVCCDSRRWDRVYLGYAKKWSQVPWVAFEDYLSEEEATELFGKEKTKEIQFTENEDEEETDDKGEKSTNKTTQIYQIWDKSDKKVKWISPQYDGYLKEQDDPLGINGFFPMPKPLMLHKKSNDMTPTALYTLYENQAKELNRITTRLNAIIEAIKFRGVYDGALGDELGDIMDEDDNSLVPTDKGASLVEGGFDKAIWTMPIDKLVTVAQALFAAREQCKAVIYEITGLSDVIRGSSKASETLGAQKIKESWGTMRLKNMQKEVQYYARDTLRIMLDVASQKIPTRLWPEMTGLPYPMNSEREKARTELQGLKQAMQRQMQNQQKLQMQIAENAKTKGRQPPPPQKPQPQQPIPPELEDLANAPTWEEILEILKNDFTRSYLIDIETNSTLDVEATEDKSQVAEFMNAMSQFMNGIQPMVESGQMPFEAYKATMLEIVRKYRFGTEVEEQFKAMKEPQKPDIKAQQEKMKQQQQEMQKKGQELQKMEKTLEDQKKKIGGELDQKVADFQSEKMQFEYDKKLFTEQQKFNEKLAAQRLDMQASEDENDLAMMFEKQKRDLQSMIDKSVARTKNANV